jgi:hypothetical protein
MRIRALLRDDRRLILAPQWHAVRGFTPRRSHVRSGRLLSVVLIASFLAANVAGAATNGQGQHHPKKGTHSGQHHGAKKHSQSGAHKKNNKLHTGQ